MSTRDSNRSTTPVAAISQVPTTNDSDRDGNKIGRQVTLTQTLTNGGTVTTAVVTLDRGAPPSETPSSPGRESTSGGGMAPQTIGIIVGCSLGFVVLVLVIFCYCVAMHRRFGGSDDESEEEGDASDSGPMPDMYRGTGEVPRVMWQFPWSIPPPTLRPGQMPVYRVRPPPQQWTARVATNPYIRTQ